MVILWLILALFGLYSIFAKILLIVAGKYANNTKVTIVALMTAIVEIVIPVSAYCVSANEILSYTMMWFSVGVLLVLNLVVYELWGKIKY